MVVVIFDKVQGRLVAWLSLKSATLIVVARLIAVVLWTLRMRLGQRNLPTYQLNKSKKFKKRLERKIFRALKKKLLHCHLQLTGEPRSKGDQFLHSSYG